MTASLFKQPTSANERARVLEEEEPWVQAHEEEEDHQREESVCALCRAAVEATS